MSEPVTAGSDIPTIPLDDFIRRFALRSSKLMWFLGAGASASSGIPTAYDMIWRFKRDLYVSRSHGASELSTDLSQDVVRHRIDAHIASIEGLPAAGHEEEYAALFKAAYPSEADRQSVINSLLAGGKPSFGHIALATLMHARMTRIVWTTNFDPLVADACAKVFDGTGALTTASLDAPELAANAISDERWPVEVKLHGDFRSRSLKNTPDELRQQDVSMRQLLRSSCARYGLIVAGYSGRDKSIVETLAEVIDSPNPYPAGLFWLRRDGEPPFQAVADLLRRGRDKEVEAALVTVTNFDETLRDITRFVDELDHRAIAAHAPRLERWTPPQPVSRRSGSRWPVLRFNAIPVAQAPTNCRLVKCKIGGTKEVQQAVESAGVDVIAVRSFAGVLAFGADEDVRKAFDPFSIDAFDLHTLEPWRSAERGLLNEAITKAVERECAMAPNANHHRDLYPRDPNDAIWSELRRSVGKLAGSVPGADGLRWREGVSIHLDFIGGKQWLLFEPRIIFEGATNENRASRTDFGRERTVKRYNRKLNELIDFWSRHLSSKGGELRAIGTSDGVDAVFRLSNITGFSRRNT